jgi:predicted transcriptional regulator
VNWNGRDLPPELRELPAGRYVVEPIDLTRDLSPEEEAGLEAGIDEIERGETASADDVGASIDEMLRRR